MPGEKTDDRKTVTLEAMVHKGQRRIALRFPYDSDLMAIAKSMGTQWSKTNTCWHVENGSANMKAIFAAYRGLAWVNADAVFRNSGPIQHAPVKPGPKGVTSKPAPTPEVPLSPEITEALQRMRQKLEIARYSTRTIDTYLNAAKKFFQHFTAKHPNDIRSEDIEGYQHHLASTRKVSNSYLNQVVNAVRYY